MKRLVLSVQGAGKFAGLPARSTLRRWIAAALERDARLTVRFVNNREGRELNRNFRDRDCATNVLTFNYATRPEVQADIVICVPVTKDEAKAQHKSLRAHLAHLLIHGTLHAQGFDHLRVADARRMERREVELLARLRIANPYEIA